MTIKEVAEKFDVTADTLRYYEKIGLIKKVPRTDGGVRNYGENELSRVGFITCMRSAGVAVEQLKKYLQLYDLGDHTANERKEILVCEREKLNAKLETLKTTIERLDYKIANYDKLLADKNCKKDGCK